MGNNKVSEKAIWEGSISPDNNTPSIASQMQTQPQMMFCYKCNNVIPSNSKFCPCCNVVLYATCPKCGVKYSSQYLICNQCGTNREEYLRVQRREQERKEAIERENRRKRLEEERRRKEAEAEKERQERLRRYEQQEDERKQKKAYEAENAEIMKTEEYKSARELFLETNNVFEARKQKLSNRFLLSLALPFIYLFLTFLIDLPNRNIELFFTILIILGVLEILGVIVLNVFYWSEMARKTFFLQYISKSNGYNRGLINRDLIQMVNYQGIDRLSACCIIAYREKHKLPINYKWHNLRRD